MKFCSKPPLIIFLFLCFSKADAQTLYNNFKIVHGVYNFKLDKTQVLSSAFIEFDEKNNELWRSAKYPKPHIEIIDIKNGKLKRKIFPQTGGCNLFKKLPNGNILIQQEDMYAIMNNHGKILKQFNEPLIGRKGSVDLYSGSSCFSPIHFMNNKILITGTILMLPMKKYDMKVYEKWGIVRSFDLNGKMTYEGTMPKQATSNFYGALNGYSSTENNGKLIIAPYYSNDIQVIDLERKKTMFYKTSTKYDKLIKPLSNIYKYKDFTFRQANEHFSNSFSLIGIVYDKYRDLYYRFVRAPGNSIPFKSSIIVMDNKFKTIFYFDIPKDYAPTQFFVDKQGLLIANNKKYKANDNILTFDLFKLTK
jgi:hypothetical protein